MGILASIVVGIGFLLTFNRFIGPERYPPHEVVLFSYGGFVNQSRHVPIKYVLILLKKFKAAAKIFPPEIPR